MKYINRKRRRKRNHSWILIPLVVLCCTITVGLYIKWNKDSVLAYEDRRYEDTVYEAALRINELCVSDKDVSFDGFKTDDKFKASALFQVDSATVIYANNIHEKIYPASTTKIMTAYLALKYGNLSDVVTVSEEAVSVPLDSSRAGLRVGDKLTLETLLYGMLLPSGNDSAVAVAEHISGSLEEFVSLMNEEAKKLGATNSNFTSPHGYHDENHYTTAYDLYLIFNECIKYDKFSEIISTASYEAEITQKNGTYRKVVWNQSNQYLNGTRAVPQDVTIIGGKTGTTDEAGSCLILYSKAKEHSYISIILGADLKKTLYDNMTDLMSSVLVLE